MIYNVNTDLLDERLAAALASLGLDSVARSGRLVIAPAEAFTTTPALDQLTDAITAEPVAAPPLAAPR